MAEIVQDPENESSKLSQYGDGMSEIVHPYEHCCVRAFYTVVLFVDGDDLHVIEVFYPTEEIYNKQKKVVESAIKTIQPKSFFIRMIEGIF